MNFSQDGGIVYIYNVCIYYIHLYIFMNICVHKSSGLIDFKVEINLPINC